MRLADLPNKSPGETVRVSYQLAPAIGALTIAGAPVWRSEPTGLSFANATGTDDAGQTGSVSMSGGTAGTDYEVIAAVTLSDGQLREPGALCRCRLGGK